MNGSDFAYIYLNIIDKVLGCDVFRYIIPYVVSTLFWLRIKLFEDIFFMENLQERRVLPFLVFLTDVGNNDSRAMRENDCPRGQPFS